MHLRIHGPLYEHRIWDSVRLDVVWNPGLSLRWQYVTSLAIRVLDDGASTLLFWSSFNDIYFAIGCLRGSTHARAFDHQTYRDGFKLDSLAAQ